MPARPRWNGVSSKTASSASSNSRDKSPIPNVVRIHDLGEVESTLYLTMEYVQGADLATLLQREPRLRYRARSRSPGRLRPDSRRRIAPGLSTAT